ncbi:lipoprotein [Mesoplasma tabanidae]|uniref:Lipoprotein n=1 Tax=Mesoplasma tabanidae TaxID=219745 RepID=A0A2K8P425_9MOLU|nr:lipoprotein [Mesoplasma tabanidae]ATZ21228.1 hypothetical protein MTABA_v1c00200 [Mesoplasma tabanidae]
MKKLLAVLGAIGLTTIGASTVVSCGNGQKNKDTQETVLKSVQEKIVESIKLDSNKIYENQNDIYFAMSDLKNPETSELLKLEGVKGISASSKDLPTGKPDNEYDIWIRLLGTQSNQTDFIQENHNLWAVQISYFGANKSEDGTLSWNTKYTQNYDLKFKAEKQNLLVTNSNKEEITEATLNNRELTLYLENKNSREAIDSKIDIEGLSQDLFEEPVVKISTYPGLTGTITFKLKQESILQADQKLTIKAASFKSFEFTIKTENLN